MALAALAQGIVMGALLLTPCCARGCIRVWLWSSSAAPEHLICGFKSFLLIREIRYSCWKWLVGFSSVVILFCAQVKGDSLTSWSVQLLLWKILLSSVLCYETDSNFKQIFVVLGGAEIS